MARPIVLTTTGVSVSSVCPLCSFTEVFNVSVNTVVTGAATYSLELTADDPFAANFDPATADWKPLAAMTGATAGAIAELTAPVRAVRINQTVGAGSVRATVIQMDI
jgi:hypothetical protein